MNEIYTQLKDKFDDGLIKQATTCDNTAVEVKQSSIKAILSHLKTTPELGYEVLIDLTAVDYLEPEKRTQVLYFLYNPTTLSRLTVTFYADRLSAVPTVTDLWEGANWYEREIYDFFGLTFEGHPGLTRILMPDDWEGHPLLRDYALTEESVEFKHGVIPKIPSEIIPHYRTP